MRPATLCRNLPLSSSCNREYISSPTTLPPTFGYLQITPGYGGRGHLEYGVYNRTGIDNTSVSGSASFIISVEEATRFSLNSNSSVTVRDGEATLVILALQPSREA